MRNHDSDISNKFRLFVSSLKVDPEDTELAFQLQNATSLGPDLLEKMVHLYAADLYRWLDVLLIYRTLAVPSHEEIVNTLRRIFERSITQIDQFHGKASVSDWLFDISLQVIGGNKPNKWLADLRKIIAGHFNGSNSSEPVSESWNNIDGLPDKLRWPLILRFLFDLDLADIAEILHIQVSDVHFRLTNARKQLLPDPITSHFDVQIQAFMDGVLDENQPELDQLLQHLADCELCQAYATRINGLEKNLADRIKDRWSSHHLNEDDFESILKSILIRKQQPKVWWKEKLPVRQSIWSLALCMIFVGLLFSSSE
jgi:DNA-directed RNA polymerase specialized sigma24 family protein